MRYSEIDLCECCNGLDVGMSLYIQGCSRHCKGCFNQETWDFNGGKVFTETDIVYILKELNRPYIHRLTILGGEPLENINMLDLCVLIECVKTTKPEIKIWLYTGYTYEHLLQKMMYSPTPFLDYILRNIDILVDGEFIEEEKDLTYPFAGSINQRIIDLKNSRETGEIVLLSL